jgi:hypothetical protein
VIHTAIHAGVSKVVVYKSLSRVSVGGAQEVFNKAMARTLREIAFFKEEQEFQLDHETKFISV